MTAVIVAAVWLGVCITIMRWIHTNSEARLKAQVTRHLEEMDLGEALARTRHPSHEDCGLWGWSCYCGAGRVVGPDRTEAEIERDLHRLFEHELAA